MRRAELADLVGATLDQFPVEPGRCEEFLRQWATPGALLVLLADVRADPDWLSVVADNSYRHALGFDKIILSSQLPRGQLRLHVWWPDLDRAIEHVHNHRFSFASAILIGRLRNTVYQSGIDTFDRASYRAYSQAASREEKRWRFEKSGELEVGSFVTVEMAATSTYTMHAGALHRVEAVSPLTVSLFLATEPAESASTVLITPSEAVPSEAAQPRFSVSEARAILDRLSAAIGERYI